MTDHVSTQGVDFYVDHLSGEVQIVYGGKLLALVVIGDLATPGGSYWTDPDSEPDPLATDEYLIGAWKPDGEFVRLFLQSIDDAEG